MAESQFNARTKAVFGTTALVAGVYVAAELRSMQWRRRARKNREAFATKKDDDSDMLRNGFSKKKVPQDIDHIIIGSGLSGLYAAAMLSKLGHKVLVLEQHYIAGGCTHTFKDQGFEFDTGVHYTGAATQLTAFMDFAAGRWGAFRQERQGANDGSEVYNEFHADGKCVHRFRPGARTFVNDLVAKWPEEEAAIRMFWREINIGAGALGTCVLRFFMPAAVWRFLLKVPGPIKWSIDRYCMSTLTQVLDRCGLKDRMLRGTLSAEFGDYGTVPDHAPFMVHAGILSHFAQEGGFSAIGGSEAYAHALVPTIVDAGGAVFVRAPVSRIVVENGRATGVEMAGGKGFIPAKCSVISSAGVECTYRKLLDDVDVQKAGGPPESLLRAERSGGTSHHVYGFVGIEGDQKELNLPTYNVWSLGVPNKKGDPCDLSASWGTLFAENKGELPSFLQSDAAAAEAQIPGFVSFPSAKDSTYSERCPGKSSAVLITEGHADYFGKAGPVNKRGEEYAVIKKRYETVMLNTLYRHFPQVKDKVTYVDIGTPLSNEHYLGRAASYGLDHDAARFIDPTVSVTVPKISGLYLTGQDIVCCGVFPQCLSAVLTLTKVLGATSPDLWLLLSRFGLYVGWRGLFDKTYRSKHP